MAISMLDLRQHTDGQRMRAVLLVFVALLLTSVVRAGSLDSSIIGTFPKNTESFAYADLAQARTFPWFAQFEAQVLPVPLHNFEQFVESPGFGLGAHIDQVVWGIIPIMTSVGKAATSQKKVAGVLIGQFDPDSAKMSLKSLNVPSVEREGRTFYASGSGSGSDDVYFTFLDANEIAFGPLDALDELIRAQDGQEENLLENASMFTLINQANGDGVFWGVMNGAAARSAVQQLVPEAGRFPQSIQLIGKFRAMVLTVEASTDIQATFQLVTAAPEDAVILSQLLQAGILIRSYQLKGDNAGLAAILDSAQIAAAGNDLRTTFELTPDQLIGLIEQNTFIRGT